jgi:hypothetical protein
LVSFSVFLFSILILTKSFSYSSNFNNLYQQQNTSNTWTAVLIISLIALVLFGLLAATTEFGI